jgi:hypothetical protein
MIRRIARDATMVVTAATMIVACSGSHAGSSASPTGVSVTPSDSAASEELATIRGVGSECGQVTYQPTTTVGTVVITAGTTSCAEAMSVVNRFLHDPALDHTGNTMSAEFDGWQCASPTAVASEVYGYLTACGRGAVALEVRAAGSTAAPQGPAPSSLDCDPAAITRDLGQQLNVKRCHGDWAYVDTGELGDAQSLLRLVNGTWTRYTGFPSSICQGRAAADGVPAAELTSFRPC